MLESQRLALQLSESREKINSFPHDGKVEELDTLTKGHSEMEVRYRAALISESAADATPNDDGEGREFGGLIARASIADYVAEAVHGKAVTGAALELRQAIWKGAEEDGFGFVPIDLFDTWEERADAITSPAAAAARQQQPIAARVFARSSAAYLGVSQPTVGPGAVRFPRISAGTSAALREDGVEVDGTAANITVEEVTPQRLTSSYTFNARETYLVSGLAQALEADLRGAQASQLDYLLINGAAAVTNVSPAVDGIISSLTVPSDPGADVAALTSCLKAQSAAVDGIYAQSGENVRLLVNPATYQAVFPSETTTNDYVRVTELLPAARFRVSAHMPAEVSDISTGIAFAAGAGVVGLVSPVWRGIELIVDRVTMAKAGRRMLTAVAFFLAETERIPFPPFRVTRPFCSCPWVRLLVANRPTVRAGFGTSGPVVRRRGRRLGRLLRRRGGPPVGSRWAILPW